jgi:hypothetical protein
LTSLWRTTPVIGRRCRSNRGGYFRRTQDWKTSEITKNESCFVGNVVQRIPWEAASIGVLVGRPGLSTSFLFGSLATSGSPSRVTRVSSPHRTNGRLPRVPSDAERRRFRARHCSRRLNVRSAFGTICSRAPKRLRLRGSRDRLPATVALNGQVATPTSSVRRPHVMYKMRTLLGGGGIGGVRCVLRRVGEGCRSGSKTACRHRALT